MGWGRVCKDPREMMVTLMVVEKYDVNLILLFAFDLFLVILDEIRVYVYNVPIGPGVVSLYDRELLVTYLG